MAYLPPGVSDWILKAPEAIDEMVSPIQPQHDLESTAVASHPRSFLQPTPQLHGSQVYG